MILTFHGIFIGLLFLVDPPIPVPMPKVVDQLYPINKLYRV